MKVLVVQSRPYQAFAGGDGAYTSALVGHLEELGCEVVGITSGPTKGRPRAWLRLAYPQLRRGRWRFRSTVRVGDLHLPIGWQLLRDTAAFLHARHRTSEVSAFTVAPDTAEQAWIAGVLDSEKPDLVILTFEAVGAVDLIRRHGAPLLALVGFLPIRSYALEGRPLTGTPVPNSAAGFLGALRRADRVGFSSHDDCNFAREALGVDDPIYIGMGFARQSEQTTGDSRVLLFVGNKTEPNREAVEWFTGRVWPLIRAAVPDARFRIVGRVATYFESDPATGIECVGEIPSLASEYCQARLVVAPLMTGSAGVKTKVAEAISYGCPLVATSLGTDGGDARQIDQAGFVADDPVRFAAHAIELLTDDTLWREKQAGTATVFNHLFSREAAYGQLDRMIADLRATGTTRVAGESEAGQEGSEGSEAPRAPAAPDLWPATTDRADRPAAMPLIFNGKFYSGRLNGVHRVADRLIRQVDQILAAQPPEQRIKARIYVPTDRTWSPEVSTIEVIEDHHANSQRWEQMTLPRLAADGVLINLCNLAPLMHRRKLLLVHDAQFLFSDSSYPTQQRLGYKYLIPLMASRAQRVLTVSDYSKRILDVSKVSPSTRTDVLYNGADHMLDAVAQPQALSEFGLAPERFVIVFGSVKEYKNVEVVFQAFRDPRLAEQTLVVVGEDEAALRAAGLNPPPGARFVGPIDDGRLRTLYENATCLAFPSKTEGFGLPPLEGMLLGCPAVVAPAGAIPEVCHDAAIYAAVDDPAEWVDAIVAIAGDRALREEKIAAGRLRAARFTWQRAGERLLAVATELATSHD